MDRFSKFSYWGMWHVSFYFGKRVSFLFGQVCLCSLFLCFLVSCGSLRRSDNKLSRGYEKINNGSILGATEEVVEEAEYDDFASLGSTKQAPNPKSTLANFEDQLIATPSSLKHESGTRGGLLNKEKKRAERGKAFPFKKNRKIHYNGEISLEVASSAEVLANIIKKVQGLGGFVDLQTKNSVTIRVPVAAFRKFYDETMTLGKVLSYSLSAMDITDQYQDLKLRRKHMKISLKKFYQLLKSSPSAAAKVAILREIATIKENLRYLEASLTELTEKAEFSVLSVYTQTISRKLATVGLPKVKAFQWIEDLNPNQRTVAKRGQRFAPPVPQQFVKVNQSDLWMTQSARHSAYWTSRHRNKLKASSQFWARALENKLKHKFSKVSTKVRGKLQILNLDGGAGEKFNYSVAVLATQDSIYLFEATFPNKKQKENHNSAVENSMAQYSGEISDAI